MSIEAENVDHETTEKELLQLILIELKLIRLHQEHTTDQKYKAEDVENEN